MLCVAPGLAAKWRKSVLPEKSLNPVGLPPSAPNLLHEGELSSITKFESNSYIAAVNKLIFLSPRAQRNKPCPIVPISLQQKQANSALLAVLKCTSEWTHSVNWGTLRKLFVKNATILL